MAFVLLSPENIFGIIKLMVKLHYEAATDEEKKSFAPYLSEDEELILATGYGSTHLRSLFIIALFFPGIIPLLLSLGVGYYLEYDLIIMTIIGVVLMILTALLKTLHTYHANRYLLTTRRVIIKKGVFTVHVTSTLYDKITHIEVEQTFFDKIFLHHGTIKVNTAGMSTDEIILRYVEHPIELKNVLERLINRERQLYGSTHIKPVVAVEGELV